MNWSSVFGCVRQLDINVMHYELAGRLVVMDANGVSRLDRFRSDWNAVLPELRSGFPNKNHRRRRFQRNQREAAALEINELNGSIESRPMYWAGGAILRRASSPQQTNQQQTRDRHRCDRSSRFDRFHGSVFFLVCDATIPHRMFAVCVDVIVSGYWCPIPPPGPRPIIPRRCSPISFHMGP